VGREAISELAEAGRQLVVVDVGETLEAFCIERGLPFVKGDATDDTVLERAGVKRARGLVVTTSSDATNLYVILTARWLNPELLIVSRAVDDASVPKLERAGANRAISPYAIGGRRLAHLIISPRGVDSFETAMRRGNQALIVDDVVIPEGSPATKSPLGSLDIPGRSGATVLAVLRDGTPTPNPAADFVLVAGDHLLVIGTDEQLARVERLLPR
jgi:voltage-gated potassium channel